METEISYRAKIGQNDHSNPYIESTTVVFDSAIVLIKGNGVVYKDLSLERASPRAINRHVTC